MKVIRKPSEKTEKIQHLKDVPPGSIIRLANVPFDEAMNSVDAPAFYIVVEEKPTKETDRVSLLPIDGRGGIIKRDADREVIAHEAELHIMPSA